MKPDVGHLRIFGYPVYFHVPKDKRNMLDATRKKGMFVGYCDNSKAFKIYVSGQRNIEFNRDVTFDEDVALGKERDIPPPPVEKKDDDMDLLECPYVPKPKKYVIDDPMEPMDPLDPTPCDPPTKKRSLWLRNTLQDVERHVAAKGTFRERKEPC